MAWYDFFKDIGRGASRVKELGGMFSKDTLRDAGAFGKHVGSAFTDEEFRNRMLLTGAGYATLGGGYAGLSSGGVSGLLRNPAFQAGLSGINRYVQNRDERKYLEALQRADRAARADYKEQQDAYSAEQKRLNDELRRRQGVSNVMATLGVNAPVRLSGLESTVPKPEFRPQQVAPKRSALGQLLGAADMGVGLYNQYDQFQQQRQAQQLQQQIQQSQLRAQQFNQNMREGQALGMLQPSSGSPFASGDVSYSMKDLGDTSALGTLGGKFGYQQVMDSRSDILSALGGLGDVSPDVGDVIEISVNDAKALGSNLGFLNPYMSSNELRQILSSSARLGDNISGGMLEQAIQAGLKSQRETRSMVDGYMQDALKLGLESNADLTIGAFKDRLQNAGIDVTPGIMESFGRTIARTESVIDLTGEQSRELGRVMFLEAELDGIMRTLNRDPALLKNFGPAAGRALDLVRRKGGGLNAQQENLLSRIGFSADMLARIQTGAALNNEEFERFFNEFLGGLATSPESLRERLLTMRETMRSRRSFILLGAQRERGINVSPSGRSFNPFPREGSPSYQPQSTPDAVNWIKKNVLTKPTSMLGSLGSLRYS